MCFEAEKRLIIEQEDDVGGRLESASSGNSQQIISTLFLDASAVSCTLEPLFLNLIARPSHSTLQIPVIPTRTHTLTRTQTPH